ncbi:MAG: GH116 family glycosyl hydrolase [Oscillospiraceae bacterium]|nr:GH116 family glycosyl hydrolase [Oscillospiraceae bacterium]
MNYGYFDNPAREYVVTRPDIPVSWTNYLGIKDFAAVVSHNAGGYAWYKSPQYHRITRFRPNAVPLDRPGYYVYIRDDETGEYWTVSWQPTGKDLSKAKYECRHGLSYSKYSCDYNGISAGQTLFVPAGDPVMLWDVTLKNESGRPRKLSVYSYCEFSYHHIDTDNQNFQMSLYCSGSSYADGIIEYDLYYEEDGCQFFTSGFEPDGYDCVRESFLGNYRTESNPSAVESGMMSNSSALCYNHCGALQKRLTLEAGDEARLWFMLGEGNRARGAEMREKYSSAAKLDEAQKELASFWDERLNALQIKTPHKDFDTMINIWTPYQAEINVLFSRFASFIETGGRTGLGYRDTAQDAMCIPHAEPAGCRNRLVQLLHGQTSEGWGIHLFSPEWFMEPEKQLEYKSPTVVPRPSRKDMIGGLDDVCSDDALWLVTAVCEYVAETGEVSFFDEVIPYADGPKATVYEHLKASLEFTAAQTGANGVAKGLRADWNDCLNLGGGESAMVSFLHLWALNAFIKAAEFLGRADDAKRYGEMAAKIEKVCNDKLWDGKWYLRGYTGDGRKIGTDESAEGKVHMESNTWAVISGAAKGERGVMCMDAVDEYLYTPYGLMLNAPSFRTVDDSVGYVTRVYQGVKENGAVFSHPNPWAWAAEAMLGRGGRAMKFYNALCPAMQNDDIETRFAEPYSYCQFVMGRDNAAHGRANHPWMTGTAGWAYFAATRYILGVQPVFDGLAIDPCVPPDWKEFTVSRRLRGAIYTITVSNPDGVQKGVKQITLNGRPVTGVIPFQPTGTVNEVTVIMGVQS